jgi:uncharacterized protein YdhG (YjbR/CyaY superfamily)
VQDFKDKLKRFSISKGTIRFTPDQALPVTLVRKLIRARLARMNRDRG